MSALGDKFRQIANRYTSGTTRTLFLQAATLFDNPQYNGTAITKADLTGALSSAIASTASGGFGSLAPIAAVSLIGNKVHLTTAGVWLSRYGCALVSPDGAHDSGYVLTVAGDGKSATTVNDVAGIDTDVGTWLVRVTDPVPPYATSDYKSFDV